MTDTDYRKALADFAHTRVLMLQSIRYTETLSGLLLRCPPQNHGHFQVLRETASIMVGRHALNCTQPRSCTP